MLDERETKILDTRLNQDRAELSEKLKELDKAVVTKLGAYFRIRQSHQMHGSQRQIPGTIPQPLVDIFNKYAFPKLNAFQKAMYRTALKTWIKANLKTI
jgi:seryl-tRNA(Sec) selenium transferase